MVTRVEKIAFIFLGVLIIALFVFWKTKWNTNKTTREPDKKERKKEKGKNKNSNNGPGLSVRVIKKWELPNQLKEISGFASINDHQLACIQDELGIIFIFDTKTAKVVKEISFGKPNDYEGIAVAGSTAYVVTANGKLYEVAQYESAKPVVTEHATPLTAKQNVEGLCYDQQNNRLLLSIKGNEPGTKDYKGIYAFDITTKNAAAAPVYKIDLTDKIWADIKGKNKIQPSDLEINPSTNEIYVIDGANPKLLVLNADGEEKELYKMEEPEFVQPEGIAFNKAGELFISSEGVGGPGTIMQVSMEAD
jgi:uncharacterized protein YjiK